MNGAAAKVAKHFGDNNDEVYGGGFLWGQLRHLFGEAFDCDAEQGFKRKHAVDELGNPKEVTHKTIVGVYKDFQENGNLDFLKAAGGVTRDGDGVSNAADTDDYGSAVDDEDDEIFQEPDPVWLIIQAVEDEREKQIQEAVFEVTSRQITAEDADQIAAILKKVDDNKKWLSDLEGDGKKRLNYTNRDDDGLEEVAMSSIKSWYADNECRLRENFDLNEQAEDDRFWQDKDGKLSTVRENCQKGAKAVAKAGGGFDQYTALYDDAVPLSARRARGSVANLDGYYICMKDEFGHECTRIDYEVWTRVFNYRRWESNLHLVISSREGASKIDGLALPAKADGVDSDFEERMREVEDAADEAVLRRIEQEGEEIPRPKKFGLAAFEKRRAARRRRRR